MLPRSLGLATALFGFAALGQVSISNLQESVKGRQATVTWTTDVAGTTEVAWGPSPATFATHPNRFVAQAPADTQHSVTLRRPPEGTLHYVVRTEANGGGAVEQSGALTIDAAAMFPMGDVSFDGPVNAVLRSGSRLYVGGSFVNAGQTTGSGVPFVGTPARLPQVFPEVAGEVYAVVAEGGGSFLIGGSFRSVGGLPRNNLARIQRDLGVDPGWAPRVNGPVYALRLYGSSVFVGGNFTEVNDTPQRFFASVGAPFSAQPGALLNFPSAVNGPVYAMALNTGALYVGGNFSAPFTSLAKIDLGNGQPLSFNPGLDGDANIYGLATSTDTLYAVGNIAQAGGQPRSNAAAFSLTTGQVTGWYPLLEGTARAVAVTPASVYVGGHFNSVGGLPYAKVAAFNPTPPGALQTGFDPEVDGSVFALHAHPVSGVVLGGSFQTLLDAAGQRVPRLGAAHVSAFTGRADAWAPNPGKAVFALGVDGETTWLGGNFCCASGRVGRPGLAALDLAAGAALDATWTPRLNGPAYALALAGQSLYVGGEFTAIGATSQAYLASVPVGGDGSPAPGFAPGLDGPVYALVAGGQSLTAGGDFTSVAGDGARKRLSELNLSTGAPVGPAWALGGGPVKALEATADRLYVGGEFLSGGTQPFLFAIDRADGGVDPAFTPSVGSSVFALASAQGPLYVGGEFPAEPGGPAHARALNGATGAPLPFAAEPDAPVWAIDAPWADRVYLGGSFDALAGLPRGHAGVVDAAGNPRPLDPGASGEVLALSAGCDGPGLILGGEFNAVGLAPRFGLAIVQDLGRCPGLTDGGTGADGGTGGYGLALSLPAAAVGGQWLDGQLTVSAPTDVPASALRLRLTGDLRNATLTLDGGVLAPVDDTLALQGGPLANGAVVLPLRVRATLPRGNDSGDRLRFEVALDAQGAADLATARQDVTVELDLTVHGCGGCGSAPGLAGAAAALLWAARPRRRRRCPPPSALPDWSAVELDQVDEDDLVGAGGDALHHLVRRP